MAIYEVVCINKDDRLNPFERIQRLGLVSANERGVVTLAEAIQLINSGSTLYVKRGTESVKVIIARSKFGNLYLKTEADGEMPNNLLSLPECG